MDTDVRMSLDKARQHPSPISVDNLNPIRNVDISTHSNDLAALNENSAAFKGLAVDGNDVTTGDRDVHG
ncbi:hypothetical protein DFR72_104471 [Lentzea flaviverrucosa]|uniref:Uncharacterized protein n=1 Tax=Lentzea flaviverrucosa TaxID=200379 RepID=A0A1H9LZR3_9PSEU|nr:hypothetical protein DFR72_104471 [Lentzea flaviverrucosa]SER16687.1 hypothetical protein SAMN05216195_104155 [Lentzea flaviverrucosa]